MYKENLNTFCFFLQFQICVLEQTSRKDLVTKGCEDLKLPEALKKQNRKSFAWLRLVFDPKNRMPESFYVGVMMISQQLRNIFIDSREDRIVEKHDDITVRLNLTNNKKKTLTVSVDEFVRKIKTN